MESLASVLPLTAIVFILSITLLPLSSGALVLFLFGAVMLIIGMGFFTMGADMSMMPMGEGIGMEMSRTKNIGGPLLVCFILGMLITIAEPDLQVLAEQVPAIPNKILMLSCGRGGAIPDDCADSYLFSYSSGEDALGILSFGISSGISGTGFLYSCFL